ncbi:MAG: class I SAM-dependent methyltransferase [Defluviitaleaceae bacterium]|nr:class I SAM-dependent methyltransferase [Defluviitaleaceae bacterium]
MTPFLHVAKNWRDYALLDAGDGEKLERWGKVTVIRPDPQAFWPRSHKWQTPDMHYHRSKSGGGSWEILSKNIPDTWTIAYENLKFRIRPTGFKHMGLFPEQAVNWTWMRDLLLKTQGDSPLADRHTPSPEIVRSTISKKSFFEEGLGETFFSKKVSPKVLNLFAYTGGATVACLAAGAQVTHVDAAKGMNNQARENVQLNRLEGAKILTDDVLKFVRREARRGNKYDGIIMDPPVFGRGPGGEMWRLEEGLFGLVEECAKLLSAEAIFFLINAYTAGFSPAAYGNVLKKALKNRPGDVSVGEVGLEAQSGVLLPCGMFSRWTSSRLQFQAK